MVENFEDRLPYLMRRVSTALSQPVDRTLQDFSLTHTQLGVLAQLDLVTPQALSGATLGERNGVTAQSVSAAITGLLERGLVHREPHPTHGRILQISITPDGAKLVRQAQAAIWKAEDRALAFLDERERTQLRKVLRLMMHELNLYLYFPDAE